MNISVLGQEKQWHELTHESAEGLTLVENLNDIRLDSSALIVMTEDLLPVLPGFTNPVFVNAVQTTLQEMKAARNVIRFNGWPGFLGRKSWEVAGTVSHEAQSILSKIGKELKVVDDQAGFVSPRIISMIINEAFFALEQDISTKDQIDIAMKLGTNYPLGPFEWCSRIGADKVLNLLNKLSTRDKRYVPSRLLAQEAQP